MAPHLPSLVHTTPAGLVELGHGPNGRWALDLKKKMGLWGHLEEEDLRLEDTFLSLAEKARRKLGVGPWPHGLRSPLGDPTQGLIWCDIQEPFLLARSSWGMKAVLGSQHWEDRARTWPMRGCGTEHKGWLASQGSGTAGVLPR